MEVVSRLEGCLLLPSHRDPAHSCRKMSAPPVQARHRGVLPSRYRGVGPCFPPQPPAPMADNDQVEKPLSTGEWFVTMLILALPLVGIIMYFVWGFGTGN